MECLAVALKELKIPLKSRETSQLKCSGNLQHLAYRHHGNLYVYHVLLDSEQAELVQQDTLEFVWLTADIGSKVMLTESQNLLVVSSNHDITWYRVATVDRGSMQVSLVCSLTAAHVTGEILKGSKLSTLTLHTSLQEGGALAVINNNMVYQVSINLSSNQLDMSACCGLRDDMGFMEAILGIRQSDTLSKLVYKHPLLFVVTSDCATLTVYNVANGCCIGAVSVKTLTQQNPGCMVSSSKPVVGCFDVADNLDDVVICLGASVMVFKLSVYFTLNKEHLNPKFVHLLAEKLIVRQSQGKGILHEEDEDVQDCGKNFDLASRYVFTWQHRRNKLDKLVWGGHSAMETVSGSRRWYEDSTILYEDQLASSNDQLSGLASDNEQITSSPSHQTSYAHIILPQASHKLVQHVNRHVVAVVMLTSSTIMVYYGGGAEGAGIVVMEITVCVLEDKSYSNCRILDGSLLVGVANASIPLAVLSPGSLVVPIVGLIHQEFVQKVLIYESAVAAEMVCKLNQWDRCFLPINALETALELRQLDTVNFFLKAKDPTDQEEDDDNYEPKLPVDLLDHAINLLIRAIKKNMTEQNQNSQFSSQLLHMTITFINELMKEEATREVPGGGPSLDELTGYMLQLRECLADTPKHTLDLNQWPGSSVEDQFGLSRKNSEMWSNLNREEILRDALLKDCLPEAQYFLIQTGAVAMSPQVNKEDSLLAAAMPTTTIATVDNSITSLLSSCVGFAVEALVTGDVLLACNLLSQMGLSIRKSLRYLCFNTLSIPLRNIIVEELRERDWMSVNELESLEYLQLLETIYPVRSYELVKSLHYKGHSKNIMFLSTALPELVSIDTTLSHVPTVGNLEELYPESFGGDYHVPVDTHSSGSMGGYLHATLQMVLTWDQATRERVLLEGRQLRLAATTNKHQFSWETQLQYFMSHNDVAQLATMVTDLLTAIKRSSEQVEMLSQLTDSLVSMTTYSSDVIRDHLARQGVILADEVNNFEKLLSRAGRTHSLLSEPHPLAHMSQLDVTAMSPASFHSAFIGYCIENNFVSLLYHYLDVYNLAVDPASIEELDIDTTAWVDVMLKFRIVAQKLFDPTAVFMASLSSGRLLLGQQGGSVMGMLSSGRPLIAMATLMYSNIGLQEAMDIMNEGQDWYIHHASLKTALAAYPKLQDAVFPILPSNSYTTKAQDVTVYNLLQGNVSFNVSNLFQWQSTNTLTSEGDYLRGGAASSGVGSEMPHFSLPSLASKYVHNQHLNYVYYLEHGQPSFAFANFVAAKKRHGRNFNKEVTKGVTRAYRMAMADFTNTTLTGACVTFTDMLSRDSTKLRVHLSSARRLLKHNEEFAGDVKNISRQFLNMKSDPQSAQVVLSKLEVATVIMVDSMEIEHCGVEALECWQLIGSFCQLHGLVPCKSFLVMCAEEGKWLPLLCHAQQLQLTPDELLGVIEHDYIDAKVKEHLVLAITATCWGEPLLSPQSYRNSVLEQQKSHKSAIDKARAVQSPLRVTRPLNLRTRYYSKMGLSVEPKPIDDEGLHDASRGPGSSSNVVMATIPITADNGDLQKELTEEDLPTDLLAVLFKCHQGPNCYQAILAHCIALHQPLLAILAACCDGCVLVECMCVWLYTSLGYGVLEKAVHLLRIFPAGGLQGDRKPELCKELQWRRWTVLDLAVMIAVGVQHKRASPSVLVLLFKYFDPNNLLMKFMLFYESFKFKANYVSSATYLHQFENGLKEGGFTGSIGDRDWLEDIANFVAAQLLVSCRTSCERCQLLKLLSGKKFAANFSHKIIDYTYLHQINRALSETDLSWDLSFVAVLQFSAQPISSQVKGLRGLYSVKVRVDSEHVIDTLLERKEFTVARQYAKIVGSPQDEISVKEVQHRLDTMKGSELWKEENTRIEFWLSANKIFQKEDLSAEMAASFFEVEVSGHSDIHYLTTMEQVLLLSLSLRWHKQARQLDNKELRQREKEIWLSHIKCIAKGGTSHGPSWLQDTTWMQDTHKNVPTSPTTQQAQSEEIIDWSLLALLDHHGPCALKELMTDNDCTIEVGRKSQSLNKEEIEALEVMLGRLLNAGRVNQATRLANLFEHGSPNLASVLCCIQLAQGKLSIDKLTSNVLQLLASNPSSRGVAGTGSSSSPSASKSQEVISLMELLADRAPHAHHCCAIIIHCFRIALAIKHPYEFIVAADPLDTLTALLSCGQVNKIAMAESFVQVCQLSAEEIADYLCDCVTSALKQYQSLTHTTPSQQSLMTAALTRANSRLVVYSPCMTSSQFVELVQLCPDPAMFGCKLFAMIKSNELSSLSSQAKLSVQVDLLIRSHDCFSIGCNIDGIAMVLELAHNITNTLNEEKEYKLMVRLLTGVGRFRELSYIIDILVSHDEFETLLSKNAEKEEQFKTALLDYLKKYHNSDSEKLRMVAGKFMMHREQAKAIEEQAKVLVKSLRRKTLDPGNPDIVKTLKNAYSYYQDAASNYAKDNCLGNTEQCMSQARLVALQLSVMKNGVRVITLDNKAVLRFLQEHNVFYEALIVADAYKSRVLIEWSVNLYHRVVLAGDLRYYNDYKCALPLTVSLFQELASKYRRDQHKTQQSAHNMKQILNDLPDLSLRHKLLQDLGYGYNFSDQVTFNPDEFIRDISRL